MPNDYDGMTLGEIATKYGERAALQYAADVLNLSEDEALFIIALDNGESKGDIVEDE